MWPAPGALCGLNPGSRVGEEGYRLEAVFYVGLGLLGLAITPGLAENLGFLSMRWVWGLA